MIYGINPYTISSIRMTKFQRWGPHPSWSKVMRKRNPIKGFFGLYEPGIFDCFFRPTVKIYGSDGDILKEIVCRSNDHAKQLSEQLNYELVEWLKLSQNYLKKVQNNS